MMASRISLSRYHFVVLFLYMLVVPGALMFAPVKLNYSIQTENLMWGIIIVASLCLLGLVILVQRKIFILKLNTKTFCVTLLYATAFAVPEEILFRGIIQGMLLQQISSPLWTVLISSGIFGIAHIFNGSKGVLLTDWNWKFVTMTFFAGLPLGFLYYLTGSLLLPTVLHVIFIVFLRLSRPA